MSVCAIVGGQFGSEGKGAIAAHIAHEYDAHVRVGAANAGHTFYTNDGVGWEDPNSWEKHVMQQLPCAAYANPDATLMVGPGALLSPEILKVEMDTLRRWRKARGLDPPMPVYVDWRAHVITRDQIRLEVESGLDKRIGSTSTIAREGVGQAQADRVMRSERCVTADHVWRNIDPHESGVFLCEVPYLLTSARSVLLEGTQGTGLSLTTGYFPYVTSRNTTVAGLCADAGIAPQRVDRTILVIRTFPIRVAGNSGPFAPGSFETSWEFLGVDPESQRTSVTKLIRRVASFSMQQVVEAVNLNGATEIALTFCDYLDPDGRGVDAVVDSIELATDIPVRYLGYGPHTIIDRGK